MGFTEDVIEQVWQKGHLSAANNPDIWRKDECGAWIGRNHYGDHASSFGWDIDHIKPLSRGGSDELSNLRPLQWENNAARGAGELKYVIKSIRNENIRV